MGCITGSAQRIGGISAYTSLICNVSKNYLIVMPAEPQWVDVNLSVDYAIETLMNWEIK